MENRMESENVFDLAGRICEVSGLKQKDAKTLPGLLDYLSDNYEILHTQSQQWLLEEMKEYLNNHTI